MHPLEGKVRCVDIEPSKSFEGSGVKAFISGYKAMRQDALAGCCKTFYVQNESVHDFLQLMGGIKILFLNLFFKSIFGRLLRAELKLDSNTNI